MQEQAIGASQMSIGAEANMSEGLKIRGHILIEKYDENGHLYGTAEAENLFLLTGINEILNLITGQSANTFTNAQAEIGIGDSSTASTNAMTDLQAATNKTYKAMVASYPTVPSAGSMQFQSSFGSADANYAWNEFVVKHLTSGICLDRGTGTFGTKASGTTWTATVTMSLV